MSTYFEVVRDLSHEDRIQAFMEDGSLLDGLMAEHERLRVSTPHPVYEAARVVVAHGEAVDLPSRNLSGLALAIDSLRAALSAEDRPHEDSESATREADEDEGERVSTPVTDEMVERAAEVYEKVNDLYSARTRVPMRAALDAALNGSER